MSKPEICVTCLFSEGAEHVRDLLVRSFRLYLQRELGQSVQEVSSPFIPDRPPVGESAEERNVPEYK